MTEIGDFMEPPIPWSRGTVTGRIQCQTPNLQNIGKDREEAEFLWQKCRQEQLDSKFKLCDSCHERFKCWTAGRPAQYHFITDDFAQVGLRVHQQLAEAMKGRVDDEILKMYGVSKDVLGQA